MSASPTVTVNGPEHFAEILSSSRLVVADFWATWCGPCKAIAPVYEQLSSQLSRPGVVTFVKIDTDAQKQIATNFNISAIPTFLIFKAGREIKRVQGPSIEALNAAVRQLAKEAADAGEAQASGSGSGAAGGWAAFAAPRGYADVTDQVDQLGLDFLNLDDSKGEKRIVFNGDKPSGLSEGGSGDGKKKDWIESDTDEQLMLFIPFQSTLKLHSLHVTSIPPKDDDDVMRPRTLHLYTNRSTVLGFDEAEDAPATQKIELKESDWDAKTGTAKVELRFVKFQNISSVVMFVQDGEGEGEKVRIDRLRLFGESGEKRKMGKLEKIGDEQGE